MKHTHLSRPLAALAITAALLSFSTAASAKLISIGPVTDNVATPVCKATIDESISLSGHNRYTIGYLSLSQQGSSAPLEYYYGANGLDGRTLIQDICQTHNLNGAPVSCTTIAVNYRYNIANAHTGTFYTGTQQYRLNCPL